MACYRANRTSMKCGNSWTTANFRVTVRTLCNQQHPVFGYQTLYLCNKHRTALFKLRILTISGVYFSLACLRLPCTVFLVTGLMSFYIHRPTACRSSSLRISFACFLLALTRPRFVTICLPGIFVCSPFCCVFSFLINSWKVKVLLYPVYPDVRNNTALFRGFQASPVCPAKSNM